MVEKGMNVMWNEEYVFEVVSDLSAGILSMVCTEVSSRYKMRVLWYRCPQSAKTRQTANRPLLPRGSGNLRHFYKTTDEPVSAKQAWQELWPKIRVQTIRSGKTNLRAASCKREGGVKKPRCYIIWAGRTENAVFLLVWIKVARKNATLHW